MSFPRIGLESILQDKAFNAAISNYMSSLDKMDTKTGNVANRLGSTFAGIGKVALAGAAAAATAAVGAVAAIGAAAFKTAVEFDDAFDTMAMATGATGEALIALQEDTKAVFRDLPVDISEASAVIGDLNVRLGLSGDAAQELGKRILSLGTDDAAKSTALYTRVVGDWSIATEDQASTLDKLFKAGQLTGASVDDLMSKVVQFGAPLRLMGFGLEESVAMFGKWEKEGVNAESVMGSLRIAAGKFAKENIPLQQGLQDTISEIQGMDDAGEALALGMEIFGARAGPDMTAAIREGRFEIGDLVEALGDSENAVMDAAEATWDYGERWKIVKNQVKTSIEPLGGMLMGALSGAVEGLLNSGIIDKVTGFFDRLASGVEIISSAFGSAEEGFAPFSEALQSLGVSEGLATTIETVANAISSAIFAFQEGSGPLEKVAGFIGSILDDLGVWEFDWDSITQVTDKISALGEMIGEFASEHAEEFKAALIAIGAIVAAATIISGIVSIGGAIAAIANPIGLVVIAVGLLAAAWAGNWGGIQTTLTAFWTGTLQPLFSELMTWLQVNIPIALEVLSGFWTNTLLPAIESVWGFIQGSVLPLLSALADVTIAALLLALTALTGLWQNVLLPALREVAGFVTEKIVPALTRAWSWISEKLSPAVETVTGLFDGLSSSGGGLAGVVEKVTGFLQGLASKLGALKLPAWLTPGSPTPFENGLVGISAALGPVIDQMLRFASSISGPQAGNIKTVASAFKDLAKGIDELAGAMVKVSALEGPSGGTGNAIVKWLDQFEGIILEAAGRIENVISLIGYDRINKLKLTSRRLAEILEAVLIDLSAIQERSLPDLGVWFGQLQDVFQRAVVVMNAIHGKWGLAVVQRAAEISKAVADTLSILGVDLTKIIPPPINFTALLAGFLLALGVAADAIIPMLSDIRGKFSGPVMDASAKAAEELSSIIGTLTLSGVLADLSKPENEVKDGIGSLIDGVLGSLSTATDKALPWIGEIRDAWGDVLEESVTISDLMKSVFGNLANAYKSAVEFAKGDTLDLGAFSTQLGALQRAGGLALSYAIEPPSAASGESSQMVTALNTTLRAGFEVGSALIASGVAGAIRESFRDTLITVRFTGSGRGDIVEQVQAGGQLSVDLARTGGTR